MKIGIYAISTCYGGAEVMIKRFCEYLNKYDHSFVLIVNKKSPLSALLQWAEQIELSEVSKYQSQITHVFMPNICGIKYPIQLEKFTNQTLFSWMIHPAEVYSSLFPCVQRMLELIGPESSIAIKKILAGHNNRIVEALQLSTSCSGLAVMDGATRRGLRYFYPEVDSRKIQTIPIPTAIKYEAQTELIAPKKEISIGYLGRIDRFKLSALKPFITHTLASLKYNNITLHFVGEGDSMQEICHACNSAKINLVNHGFQYNDEAIALLQPRVQLGVAMGTSALDLAGAGIPTIIIDPAFKKNAPAQNLFRFVHEISDCTLGEYRDSRHYMPGLHNFGTVLDLVRFDMSLPGKQQFYIQNFHSKEIVFKNLLQCIVKSTLKIHDFAPLAKEVADSYAYIDAKLRWVLSAGRHLFDKMPD